MNPSFENGFDGQGIPLNWNFEICEGVGNATATLDSTTYTDGSYSSKVYSGPITQTYCLPTNGTRNVGFTQFRQFVADPVNFTDLTDSQDGFSFWFKLQPYDNQSGMAGFDIRVFGAESTAELDYAFNPDPSLTFVNQTGIGSFLFHGYQPDQWYHFSRNLRADWMRLGLPLKHLFTLVMFEGLVLQDGPTVKSETFWLDDVKIYAGNLPPSVAITSLTPSSASTGETVTLGFAVNSTSPVSEIVVNWGDGTTTRPSTGARVDSHIYRSTGDTPSRSFTINVTVTNTGGRGFAVADENVKDRPPTVTITGLSPSPQNTGQLVQLNFTASDPDGTISAVRVDWGDDSKPDLILTISSNSMCPATNCVLPLGAIILVRWEDPAMIAQGTIIAFRPVGWADPNYLVIHRVVSVMPAGAQSSCSQVGFYTKGDANSADDPWDVGCGLPISQVVGVYQSSLAPPNGPTITTYATHTYANTGNSQTQTFTILVNATDNSGSFGSQTFVKVIKNLPPSMSSVSVSPNPVVAGNSVTVLFSARDPDGTVSSISINWGDGTAIDSLGSSTTSDMHTYASAGSFTISITASDNTGSRSQATSTVTVNAPSSPTEVQTPTIFGVSPSLFYYAVLGITAIIMSLAVLITLRKRKNTSIGGQV